MIDFDAGVDGLSPTQPNALLNEAADMAGSAGQGNSPNPPSTFGNHWIVKMNNNYYDPSYGLGPFTDLKKYEDDACEGSMDVIGMNYFLSDRPADNNTPSDHTDEINNYNEFTFP